MDKMKQQTPDLTAQNVDRIAALFPNCITESRDENGKLKRAVNFDLLRQMLSGDVVEGDEAYEFTWVGKKAAIVEANRPIRKTLRPCPEESVNWDTTENLYIEGDNLEVLKLLQESYLGKVKMIYIDPPYNTGNDFIYRDNFAVSQQEWSVESGEWNEDGERLFRNTDSNGRFHSDWCSMIYSRLLLARNLLTDDGVIFISIDDNEVTNLRSIADEVFGKQNFIVQIIWKKRSTPPNDQVIGASHEYVLIYAREMLTARLNLRERSTDQNERYKNPDNHPKGPWAPGDLSANVKGGRYVASLNYPIVNPNTGEEHYPPHNGNWRFSREKVNKLLQNNEISFGENGLGRPKLKRFLCDVKQGITYTSLWDFVPLNTQGSKEMTELLGNLAVFDNPKPTGLIKEVLKLGSNSDSIVLDFFSGSATTAHAVMQLNAEDGGNRKFIMVQLPEACDEKSEAYKAGYKTICDIGKERIRRAGQKILTEWEKKNTQLTMEDNSAFCAPNSPLDIGFRVLKLDTTNMTDVYYSADEYDQQMLSGMESNIKPDRTDLDLLFGCLLDWGLPLSMPYTSEEIGGCTVHTYNEGDLIACFNEDIPESVIREIAKRKPLRAVFRDSSFADSPAKINVGEIFKLLAPDTRVKVI